MAANRSRIKCAKWCGRGCTRKEYETAERNALELTRRLGKGWKPDVWENLGWHYATRRAGVRVIPHYGAFTAYLNYKKSPGGRWVATASTPDGAIAKALALARKERDDIAKAVRKVEKYLGEDHAVS